MDKISASKIMNGTYGSVWINGEYLADIDSFEAKINIDYEDVNMAGSLSTHKKMIGWSGEGTISLKKIYSRGSSLIGKSLKDGICPTFTVIAKLADPNAFGAERVALKEVTFSELMLVKFEQKTKGTEELPFSFAEYELIDLVEA